jgi:hypothetical protein
VVDVGDDRDVADVGAAGAGGGCGHGGRCCHTRETGRRTPGRSEVGRRREPS